MVAAALLNYIGLQVCDLATTYVRFRLCYCLTFACVDWQVCCFGWVLDRRCTVGDADGYRVLSLPKGCGFRLDLHVSVEFVKLFLIWVCRLKVLLSCFARCLLF